MGRRSTKTTKAGKFMNPTDQWRKTQRKKELKKNKKQRATVREAVLRLKDPDQMLIEIEEIEKIEVESTVTPLPNEKGLQEKKRKLHASIDRIIKYYQKEDPKKASEIKQMVLDSEKRRREMTKLYNSYRAARSQYDVSDIPMPDTTEGQVLPMDIPMPDEIMPGESGPRPPPPPPGPLPPGPPSCPPPTDLHDYEIIEQAEPAAKKSVRFIESDDDDLGSSDSDSDDESDSDDGSGDEEAEGGDSQDSQVPPGPPSLHQQTAPPLMRVPPPPPAGPPPMFRQQFRPRMGIPPGPPPGMPPPTRPTHRPGMLPQPLIPPNPNRPHIQSQAVLSAPPTRNKPTNTSGGSVVISAQPQLRNMQAEVTKFLPTSLRVRRDQPKVTKVKVKVPTSAPLSTQQRVAPMIGARPGPGAMQGDAYEAFMKEMQGLL